MDISLFAIQSALLFVVLYESVTAMWGWSVPAPAPSGPRDQRFRIVVPAHNEANVIEDLLQDLGSQGYSAARYMVVVVADRCSDETTSIARRMGCRVFERHTGPESKGSAILSYLRAEPLTEGESLIVLDADNRVPPTLLERLADELDAGHEVLQCYLGVTNPDASWIATAGAVSYWVGNRGHQLSRRNLGWSSDLGGTGMCIKFSVLKELGGVRTVFSEDLDLAARIVLSGRRVVWLHDVVVLDEKPPSFSIALKQRARWSRGDKLARRSYLRVLLRAGMRRRSVGVLDFSYRLVRPSRGLTSLGVAFITAVSAVVDTDLLWPWPLWLALFFLLLGLPLALLWRERVPRRYLLLYPATFLVPLVQLAAACASRLRWRGWYHTPHTGRARD